MSFPSDLEAPQGFDLAGFSELAGRVLSKNDQEVLNSRLKEIVGGQLRPPPAAPAGSGGDGEPEFIVGLRKATLARRFARAPGPGCEVAEPVPEPVSEKAPEPVILPSPAPPILDSGPDLGIFLGSECCSKSPEEPANNNGIVSTVNVLPSLTVNDRDVGSVLHKSVRFGTFPVHTTTGLPSPSVVVGKTFGNSRGLKYVKPEFHNGEVLVKPSVSVGIEGAKKWESTLVGYFLGKSPPNNVVKNYFYSVWEGLLDVITSSEGFYFFKFDGGENLSRALEGGPWLIQGQSIFLSKWKHGISVEYEWLPHRCGECRVFGHRDQACPSRVNFGGQALNKPVGVYLEKPPRAEGSASSNLVAPVCSDRDVTPPSISVSSSAGVASGPLVSVCGDRGGTGVSSSPSCGASSLPILPTCSIYKWNPNLLIHCQVHLKLQTKETLKQRMKLQVGNQHRRVQHVSLIYIQSKGVQHCNKASRKKPGSRVLVIYSRDDYQSGIMISHISDIVGPVSMVYLVDHHNWKTLANMADKRFNIVSIHVNTPQYYRMLINMVDVLFGAPNQPRELTLAAARAEIFYYPAEVHIRFFEQVRDAYNI
ncbi:Small subunit processome complex component [Orobanche hederae]